MVTVAINKLKKIKYVDIRSISLSLVLKNISYYSVVHDEKASPITINSYFSPSNQSDNVSDNPITPLPNRIGKAMGGLEVELRCDGYCLLG